MLPAENRATHMHVIGSSGSGKSRFLEHLIRRDIVAGRGVCVIDPHGTMYRNLVNWMIGKDIRVSQLHLLDLNDKENAVGFNPLVLQDRNPMRRVVDMLQGFERVWGNSMNDTPRLKKCLRMTLYPLAVHNLSLLDADKFTSASSDLRRPFINKLPNTVEGLKVKGMWEEFDQFRDREFREYFESTQTRIFELVTSPAISRIIGQTKDVLDFKRCMDRGHVVLINLNGGDETHEQDAQVLGALLTAELYAAAKLRDEKTAEKEPFYTYIDECADYINSDIAKSLDQTRKFGLHFVLSHQRMGQLHEAGEGVYNAVAVNAKTKVVFALEDADTAEYFAKRLFQPTFSLEVPKEIMNKPVAVGQELIELFSESDGVSEGAGLVRTETYSTSTSSGQGSMVSNATSVFVPIDNSERGITEIAGAGTSGFTGSASGEGVARSEIRTGSTSKSFTKAQALATVYEVMPTQLYTLEEQLHLATTAIINLPKRTAFVKVPTMMPVRMDTMEVETHDPLNIQERLFKRFAHPGDTVDKAYLPDDVAEFDDTDDDTNPFIAPIPGRDTGS